MQAFGACGVPDLIEHKAFNFQPAQTTHATHILVHFRILDISVSASGIFPALHLVEIPEFRVLEIHQTLERRSFRPTANPSSDHGSFKYHDKMLFHEL